MERKQGKSEAENKVSFSSIKHSENKHGNLVSTLYMNAETAELLAGLLAEACAASEAAGTTGAKITIQTISGEKYDSAYAYVNGKEPPRENTGGGKRFNKFSNGNSTPGGNGKAPNSFGASKTKQFFKSKQVANSNGEEAN